MQRAETLQALAQTEFDVLIIGGGINGAVAASVLSAHGSKVALVDRGDFAVGSSSHSSNLAWGGIKYLESGELLLVQKLCRSRNHLMENYPTRVKEIRFFATINRGFRWPAWVIFCGAVLYWFMGACRTRPPRFLRQHTIANEQPIINSSASAGGVEYSDCYLPGNDARFVFNFIRTARQQQGVIANYVEALYSTRDANKLWVTTLQDVRTSTELVVRSKAIINACGPYVDAYNQHIGQLTRHKHVFSKGVHLIVPQLIAEEKILAFFASDGRLFFVIPMGQCTCIGTTDTPVDIPHVTVSDEDRDFILHNANHLLRLSKPLTRADIIAERCGVRPLVVKKGKAAQSDWMKLSRKHQIHSNVTDKFISIFGGKITDCLNVGEEVLDICRQFGVVPEKHWHKWYGEPSLEEKNQFIEAAAAMGLNHPDSVVSAENNNSQDETIAERWWRRFGAQAYRLLDLCKDNMELLQRPIPSQDYCGGEIALMGEIECIVTLDDFFRRRTKIALTMAKATLLDHPGILAVARLLFGLDQAEAKVAEYKVQVTG